MTMIEPIPAMDTLEAAVRAVLQRNGVFMTRHGPLGPEQLEQEVLSGMNRDEAIDKLARRVAAGEAK